ncbi:glycoprotein-N-acetylgalactosamine 3-beta-galactosyltransferase 1 [Drosophila busckii]|uniref:glycoprotein-N-acetylgalactosamine 3-beta-galactosyltransferase 1 n=1 Tax=Drosophila busckii TaxID=30019 RepID=UPI00083EAF82|nr:glycoprotein-N-acetylgalactosamine 3-beta-galactosyltransferase 1 [Drosophila busckii]
MPRYLSTRRFCRCGKNKISILNPCGNCCQLTLHKLLLLLLLALICLLWLLQSQRVDKTNVVTKLYYPRIFCIIVTYEYLHQYSAVHLKRTWVQHCDRHLFVSDAQHAELEPAVFLGLTDKWQRLRAQLEYVYNYHYADGDWFLIVNDDNFVVVDNLRHMLLPYNPKQRTYFGCKLKSAQNQTYMYDRSGIVLSSAALQQFVLKALPNETICSSGPQDNKSTLELARCLDAVQVEAGNSLDHLGHHRFLPFTLAVHLHGQLNVSIDSHSYFLEHSYYEVNNLSIAVSNSYICQQIHYMPIAYDRNYMIYNVKLFGVDRTITAVSHLKSLQKQKSQPFSFKKLL